MLPSISFRPSCQDAPSNPLSDSLTSHPIGTTVRATNLFYQMPVRRQMLVGKASKTMDEIKSMLRSYAFARPQIRWSMKILGGRDTQSDWTYAPPRQGTIRDVARALVSKKVAEECVLREWASVTADNDLPGIQGERFRIEALLPKADCGEKIYSRKCRS